MMEVWQRSRRRLGFVTLGCLLVFCKTGSISLIIGTRSGLAAKKGRRKGPLEISGIGVSFFAACRFFVKARRMPCGFAANGNYPARRWRKEARGRICLRIGRDFLRRFVPACSARGCLDGLKKIRGIKHYDGFSGVWGNRQMGWRWLEGIGSIKGCVGGCSRANCVVGMQKSRAFGLFCSRCLRGIFF